MLLQNRLRCELQDSDATVYINGMTAYDLHYMIYRLIRIYGRKIEQMDTLRAIIDH